ncbi:hypothetical protein PENTCL1PPCAC_20294, partial [Pristionchus entomophagus]
SPEAGGPSAVHNYNCQRHEPLTRVRLDQRVLNYFDLFARTSSAVIPVRMCITYQQWEQYYDEMCACAFRDNCTTSSKYPANSGL